MKKYIIVLIGLMAYFSSCTDQDEVDINYQVDFTVSPAKVMENFKEVKEGAGNLELTDEYKLRLSAFIYDQEGNLVLKNEKLVDNYNTDFTFSDILPTGNYTVVALSSVVVGNSLDNLETELYLFSDYNRLNEFTIEQHNFRRFSVLGIAEYPLNIDNQKQEATIRLKPATSMLELHWMRPQLFDLGLPTGHQLLGSNETYSGMKYNSPDWEPFNKLGTSRVWILNTIDEETCTQTKYGDIYDFLSILPQKLEYYVETNYVNTSGISKTKTYAYSSITLEQGKQHVLHITPYKESTESIGTRSMQSAQQKMAPTLTRMLVKTLLDQSKSYQ